MTKFDYIVMVLLLISALVGFSRGAVRELVAMIALVAGGAAALFGLPHVTPLAERVIRSHWLAAIAAFILLFIAAYVVLRLLGAVLVKRIRGTNVLSALDRTIGLAIGVARGLVVLGALYQMFTAATPADLRPRWITGARTWPLARDMGQVLEKLAPKGMDLAARIRPTFEHIVREPLRDRSTTGEYDARQRGEVDDLVEKSR